MTMRQGEDLGELVTAKVRALGPGAEAELVEEARSWVNQAWPWNGRGAEPVERVSAYLGALWMLAEEAGGAQ